MQFFKSLSILCKKRLTSDTTLPFTVIHKSHQMSSYKISDSINFMLHCYRYFKIQSFLSLTLCSFAYLLAAIKQAEPSVKGPISHGRWKFNMILLLSLISQPWDSCCNNYNIPRHVYAYSNYRLLSQVFSSFENTQCFVSHFLVCLSLWQILIICQIIFASGFLWSLYTWFVW